MHQKLICLLTFIALRFLFHLPNYSTFSHFVLFQCMPVWNTEVLATPKLQNGQEKTPIKASKKMFEVFSSNQRTSKTKWKAL